MATNSLITFQDTINQLATPKRSDPAAPVNRGIAKSKKAPKTPSASYTADPLAGTTSPVLGGGGSFGLPSGVTPTGSTSASTDMRVRVGFMPESSEEYSGILAPLKDTQGLMFPYTPSISVSQDVDYAAMQMVHSNTDYYSFARSPNASISITGKFTVQNQAEGIYALAAIHFCRSVSKMYFGQKDGKDAGTPPPILHLNGYGTYMFNKVRVFMRTHSYSYDENMDTVPISTSSGTARLPVMFTLQISLTTQPTPRMMREDFSLKDYRSGELLNRGGFF